MGDEHITNTTQSGASVELYIKQDVHVSYVGVEAEHIGSLCFNFNPDFPQDAHHFYESLLEVRSIIMEETSRRAASLEEQLRQAHVVITALNEQLALKS